MWRHQVRYILRTAIPKVSEQKTTHVSKMEGHTLNLVAYYLIFFLKGKMFRLFFLIFVTKIPKKKQFQGGRKGGRVYCDLQF